MPIDRVRFSSLGAALVLATIAPGARPQAEPTVPEPEARAPAPSVQETNKALARDFYRDLWFTNQTDNYARYVADRYVVHDIGDRKGVVEPAVEQKRIADFFHANGEMTGTIDFQIAEGDLVATRWQLKFKPTSLMFKIMGGRHQIPIINVFRFRDGKIVEIWNHRHDIDTGAANFKFVRGLAVGLVVALAGWTAAFVFWRRSRRLTLAVGSAG